MTEREAFSSVDNALNNLTAMMVSVTVDTKALEAALARARVALQDTMRAIRREAWCRRERRWLAVADLTWLVLFVAVLEALTNG